MQQESKRARLLDRRERERVASLTLSSTLPLLSAGPSVPFVRLFVRSSSVVCPVPGKAACTTCAGGRTGDFREGTSTSLHSLARSLLHSKRTGPG